LGTADSLPLEVARSARTEGVHNDVFFCRGLKIGGFTALREYLEFSFFFKITMAYTFFFVRRDDLLPLRLLLLLLVLLEIMNSSRIFRYVNEACDHFPMQEYT
jgi:hypothetical protein